MSIKSVMLSNHLILWCSLFLPPSIFPSIRVFSNESVCIRWPKYWSFSFSISPSNEHSGLISIRMNWLDLLAVQGTLKSLLQHHSSKASIFWCSAFFLVQLSHPYMTAGKTMALTRWTSVSRAITWYLITNEFWELLSNVLNKHEVQHSELTNQMTLIISFWWFEFYWFLGFICLQVNFQIYFLIATMR